MEQARITQMALRIEHRHRDGSWGEMVEDRSHHAPADHDPERSWNVGRLFRCSSCDESLTVSADDEGAPDTDR
jgi:hypothetical protein